MSMPALIPLTLTLAGYGAGLLLMRLARRHPLANPVLSGVVVVALGLWVLDLPYAAYLEGAEVIAHLLGTAAVALAIPLFRHRATIRNAWKPLLISVLVIALAALLLGRTVGFTLQADPAVSVSLAIKQVTTPFALEIGATFGDLPALTAALVILSGILTAMTASPLLDRLGVTDHRARGVAMGMAGHGIATARALQEHPERGAFAGLTMGLMGVATAVLAPLIL